MNTSALARNSGRLLGAVAALCCLLNSGARAVLPGVLDSAFNPTTGHTYYLLETSSWTDAENAGVTLGGHLTTINNLAENNWIWDRWGMNRDLWIGLFDPVIGDGGGAQHAANFRWSSGDTSTYRNWRPGEPNNVNNDYFAYILGKGLVPEGGVWNDILDDGSNPGELLIYGVVEVPEPSMGALLAGGCLAGLLAKRKPRVP